MKISHSAFTCRLACVAALSLTIVVDTSDAASVYYGADNVGAGERQFPTAVWVNGPTPAATPVAQPGMADTAFINQGDGLTDYPYINTAVTLQRFLVADAAGAGGLEIRASGTLTTTSTSAHYLGSRGTGYLRLLPGSTMSLAGALNVGWGADGTTPVRGIGTVTQTGGTFTGAGVNVGTIAAAGPLPASVGAYILQNGSMTLAGPLAIGIGGVGTFNMSGGAATINNYLQIGRNGTGTFTHTAGALVVKRNMSDTMVIGADVGGVGKYEISGGSLAVSTVTGLAVVTNGIAASTAAGTFKVVGTGPTSIAIAGDYKQYIGATLELDVTTGITPINLTGTATLGGTLDVDFLTTPSIGQTFTVMNYGSRVGTFGTFNSLADSPLGPNTISLSVSYGSVTNGSVVVTVVPEPATRTLAATGLALTAAALRRTRRGF